jgi:hypothetical protein
VPAARAAVTFTGAVGAEDYALHGPGEYFTAGFIKKAALVGLGATAGLMLIRVIAKRFK